MPPDDMDRAVDHNMDKFATARVLSALWDEIAEFLCEGKATEWARVKVSGDGAAGKITVRSFRSVHDSWFAPTLVLDATAPSIDVLQKSLGAGWGLDVVEKDDIAAQWSPHIHVRQIFGAPVAMGKVGLFGDKKPENVRDILRYIRLRAALSYPAAIGLITYKGLLNKLQGKLPKNVTVTAHFGALAGLNSMEQVGGVIILGRPYIKPAAAEAYAEVFDGQPVPSVGKFYPARTDAIPLSTGADYEVKVNYHPHPLAEALRWQGGERGLRQAVGRVRPHRRTARCWLDIITDLESSSPVNERVAWDAVMPGAFGDMADAGVILLNRRHVDIAFKGLSERQGRSAGSAEVGYDSLYINLKGIVPNLPCHRITYQRDGPGQKRNAGYYFPNIIGQAAELHAWLEEKLGPLVALEIEHPTGLAEWQPETTPIGDLVRVFRRLAR